MIDILVSYLEQKRKQAKKNDAYVTARAYSPLIDAIKLTKSALKAVGHLGLVAYKVVNGLFHKSAEKAFSGSPDWEEFATKEKQRAASDKTEAYKESKEAIYSGVVCARHSAQLLIDTTLLAGSMAYRGMQSAYQLHCDKENCVEENGIQGKLDSVSEFTPKPSNTSLRCSA